MHFLPCSGMNELQLLGVEHLPVEQGGKNLAQPCSLTAVQRVSQKGMPRGGHMDTDLMGTTCLQLAFHVGKGILRR